MIERTRRWDGIAFAALLAGLAGCMLEYRPLPGDAGGDAGADDAGGGCLSDSDCDDGIFCDGEERCASGECVPGEAACDDGVECTLDVCDEAGRTCVREPRDEACDDGDFCNGAERCEAFVGCVASRPISCDDTDPCTTDACEPALGCTHRIRDLDGDGYGAESCGGPDCDDRPGSGAMVHPGATEICDNGIDDDCDGILDVRDPSCVASNDTCETATVLPGAGSYPFTFRGLTEDESGADLCSVRGPDAYFRFSITETHDVRVRLNTLGGDQSVRIRRASECSTGPTLRCGINRSYGCDGCGIIDFAYAEVRDLPAGDYVIVASASGGEATLDLHVDPPSMLPVTDRCEPMTLDVSAGGSWTGLFEEASDDYVLTCGADDPGYTGREVAFRLSVTETSDIAIEAQTSPRGPRLAIVRDCADPSREMAFCAQAFNPDYGGPDGSTGGALRFVRRDLTPGDYWILLEEGATPPPGGLWGWSLDTEVWPSSTTPAGDTCTRPVAPMPLALAGFRCDSCIVPAGPVADAYYRVVVPATSDVEVRIDLDSNDQELSIALEPPCGSASTMIGEAQVSWQQWVQRRFHQVSAGTYEIRVRAPTARTITPTVRVLAPTAVPTNDDCARALPIVLPSFAHDGTLFGGPGRSAYYRLDLAGGATVSFSALASAATGASTLTLYGSTCDGATLGTGMNALSRALTAGTYFVRVQGPEADFRFTATTM